MTSSWKAALISIPLMFGIGKGIQAQNIDLNGKTTDSRFAGSGVPNIEVVVKNKDDPNVVYGKDTTGVDGLWGFEDIVTDVKNNKNVIPENYSLSQNYPNPFNPTSNVNFFTPNSGYFTFEIFDVPGRLVDKEDNLYLSKGAHKFTITAPNASGVYVYRMRNNDGSWSKSKKFIALDGQGGKDLIKYLGAGDASGFYKLTNLDQLILEFNSLDNKYENKTETIDNISQNFNNEVDQIPRQGTASIQGSYTSNPSPEIDLEGVNVEIKLDGNNYDNFNVSGGSFDIEGIEYDYFENPQNPEDKINDVSEVSVMLTGNNLTSNSKTIDFSEVMNVGEIILNQNTILKQAELSGNVKDDSQNNLSGVNVSANGSNIHNGLDVSDIQGNYSITLNFDAYPYSPSIILPNNVNVNGSKTGYNSDNTNVAFDVNGMIADLELEKIVTTVTYDFNIQNQKHTGEPANIGIYIRPVNRATPIHFSSAENIPVSIELDQSESTNAKIWLDTYGDTWSKKGYINKTNQEPREESLAKADKPTTTDIDTMTIDLAQAQTLGTIVNNVIQRMITDYDGITYDMDGEEYEQIAGGRTNTGRYITFKPETVLEVFISEMYKDDEQTLVDPAKVQETEDIAKRFLDARNTPYIIKRFDSFDDPDVIAAQQRADDYMVIWHKTGGDPGNGAIFDNQNDPTRIKIGTCEFTPNSPGKPEEIGELLGHLGEWNNQSNGKKLYEWNDGNPRLTKRGEHLMALDSSYKLKMK